MTDKITYIYKAGLCQWFVFLGKKRTGAIRHVEGGYAYFPRQSDGKGDTHKTLEECKKSLEGE